MPSPPRGKGKTSQVIPPARGSPLLSPSSSPARRRPGLRISRPCRRPSNVVGLDRASHLNIGHSAVRGHRYAVSDEPGNDHPEGARHGIDVDQPFIACRDNVPVDRIAPHAKVVKNAGGLPVGDRGEGTIAVEVLVDAALSLSAVDLAARGRHGEIAIAGRARVRVRSHGAAQALAVSLAPWVFSKLPVITLPLVAIPCASGPYWALYPLTKVLSVKPSLIPVEVRISPRVVA